MATTTTEGARTSGVILRTVVVFSEGTFPLDIADAANMASIQHSRKGWLK